MEPRISFLTLGVEELSRSVMFYRDVLELPVVKIQPEIAFFELGKTWLALFPRDELAADAGVPAAGSGFPRFTIAHNVRSAAEVDALLAHVASHGGRIIKSAQRADWGGYSGYFADPDDFLWEVCWNSRFPHV